MPRSLSLEWDAAYGVGSRRGWTASVNGRVLVQLTWLPRALLALAWGCLTCRP